MKFPASMLVGFLSLLPTVISATTVHDGGDFTLTLRQNPSAEPVIVSASAAVEARIGETNGVCRIDYAFTNGPIRKAVAICHRNGVERRYGLEVETAEGWSLEKMEYPKMTFPAVIGESVDDDRMLADTTKGGVIVAPGRHASGWVAYGRIPRGATASFVAFWDNDRGWYIAAEDPDQGWKKLGFRRTDTGIDLICERQAFETGYVRMPYDVVIREVMRQDEPLVWQDFADLYRPFLSRCTWGRTPYVDRPDIPDWLKDAPSFVLFSRQWLEHPDWLEGFTSWWRKTYGDGPVVAALWGWEKEGTWWGPDYFPCHPSDETFRRNTSLMRTRGFHPFAWPSGYNWAEAIGRRPDGTFDIDYRDTFIRNAETMLVRDRNGIPLERDAFWLQNGMMTALCGGVPAARDWFCGVARGLAERGCELVQVDQQVGGDLEPCYAVDHGHPAGVGPWQRMAFSELLRKLSDDFRKVIPSGVIAFEEPNPVHIDNIGIQDYRDLESGADEYASVFNYLFHGYIPTFQSNPMRGDLYSLAWQATDGQMPFHRPMTDDFAATRPALANGGFEEGVASVRGPVGWDRIMAERIYNGVDVEKPVWDFAGSNNMGWLGIGYRWQGDDCHSGERALLIDPELSTSMRYPLSTVQIAQTVEGLEPGTYILSAWVKTERGNGQASIRYGSRIGERGALEFPPAGTGWQRILSEVVVGDDGILRIIVFVRPGARVLVDDIVLSDMSGAEVRMSNPDPYVTYIHRWISLYRGAGRPFLAEGFQEKPPRLACARLRRLTRTVPAVCHAVYRARDGRRALVLANGTDRPQEVRYRWNGCDVKRTLAPVALELIEEEDAVVFAASEMHRIRIAKRIEAANGLNRPVFADNEMRADDLKGFSRYLEEERYHWRTYPGNPAVCPTVLSVTDFGAVGDGTTPNDAAFARAVNAVRAKGGQPTILTIPAGTYFLAGSNGEPAHVNLSGLTNCVVTGEGPERTRFLYGEYDIPGVLFNECCNSTLSEIEMYWRTCPFAQGVVEQVDRTTDPHTLIIRHEPGTKRPDDPHFRRTGRAQVCATFDANGHQVLGSPLFFDAASPMSAEDIGGGRFRIRLDKGHKYSYDQLNVKEGMTVVLPDRISNVTAVRAHQSRFCNFVSIWIRNSPEAAFTTGGEYITAWKCRVFPLQPNFRLSTNADAFYNAPGTFLGHCEFRNMNDDGGNCHSRGVALASVDFSTRTIRFAQQGISAFRPGEPLQIYRATTGALLATLHVERGEIISDVAGRTCVVTMREPLPTGLLTQASLSVGELTADQRYALSHGVGEKPKMFADLVYAPHGRGLGYVVTGCTFADFRGIAINTQCPNSLIENNTIEYCNHGVQVSSLMMWYEGLPSYNLTIRGNVFRHTLRGVNGFLSRVDSGPCETDYIHGVRLEGNVYDSVVYPVRFRNCRDVEIGDNVRADGNVRYMHQNKLGCHVEN